MDLKSINTIGVGAYFPITLTTIIRGGSQYIISAVKDPTSTGGIPDPIYLELTYDLNVNGVINEAGTKFVSTSSMMVELVDDIIKLKKDTMLSGTRLRVISYPLIVTEVTGNNGVYKETSNAFTVPVNTIVTLLEDHGEVEGVVKSEGGKQISMVTSADTWSPLRGDTRLIKQNIAALLIYQIGFRFRQENFGSRIWECLEEPNDNVVETLIRNFLAQTMAAWEPRVSLVKVSTVRYFDKLAIKLFIQVRGDRNVQELNFEYNNQQNTISYVGQ